MKKTLTRITGKLLAVAFLATLVAGCSDGELGSQMQDFSISPAAPIIVSFYAEPEALKAGESTTISWEVAGADSVEIVAVSEGAPIDFHVQTDELSGSATAANLTATTQFTLTATKQLAVTEGEEEPAEGADEAAIVSSWIQISSSKFQEAEEEGEGDEGVPAVIDPTGSSVSQTLTVTVEEAAELNIKTFQSDHERLNAGERTVLRWEVEPAEGVDIVVESTDPDEVIAATDQCDGSMDDITVAGEPEAFPAVGCAVVTPLGRTTYTISAAMTDDPSVSATKDLVIDVIEQHLQVVSFTIDAGAGKQENAVVLNYDDPVTLEWQASPETAVVTISADAEVKGCDLTQELAATGTLSCTPTADTTFTMIATLGNQSSDPRVATVTKRVSSSADIKIISDGWAFAGEEVEVEVEPIGSAEMITKIVITDAASETGRVEISGFQGQQRIAKKVKVPARGVSVKWECPDCQVPQRDVSAVTALPTMPKAFRDGTKPLSVTRIVTRPDVDGVFLYGVDRGGYNGGEAFLFQSGISLEHEVPMAVDFGPKLLALDNMSDYVTPTFLNKMAYPVEAVAVQESGRIFAGIPGTIMYSDDNGESWELFEMLLRFADRHHTYPGSHPTCAGETQQGIKHSGDRPELVSFGGVCDLLAIDEDRLIAATDRGAYTLPSASAHLSDRNGNPWMGMPPKNGTFDSGAEYLTYSRVVNDLELVQLTNTSGEVTSTKVFAAASQGGMQQSVGGVFVSSDKGETWEAFGLEDVNVYSLTYDRQTRQLYAGTAEGVQVSSVDSASWSTIGSLAKPVFSVAIDPYSAGGVMIAGTDEGIAILRDITNGAWQQLEAGGANGVGKVRAVALESRVDETAGSINHYLSVGTAKGVIAGNVTVNITGVIDTSEGADDAAADESSEEETEE